MATPSHASADVHEAIDPVEVPQISGAPSPIAAPMPAYAGTHRTHLGVIASSAAGNSQRTARGQNSVRCDGIGGLIVTIMIPDPTHCVFRILVATLRYEVEYGVGAD